MKTKFLTLLIVSVLASSCATVFCGSKKRIIIDSNVEKVDVVTIDGNKYKDITFPFTVKIKRGFNETIVKGEAEGYHPEIITINKNFNAVSVINIANIFGWGIDAATGAMTRPEFNNYVLEFELKK